MRIGASWAAAALTFAFTIGARGQRASAALSGNGIRMPRIFADGMVLQRGQAITLWGWTTPHTDVLARLASRSAVTRADANGAWTLKFPAHPAGGPFRLTVRAGGDSLVFADVLIGDVWVVSGQSNMEFQVASAANAREAIATANDSTIREFKIPNSWSNAAA